MGAAAPEQRGGARPLAGYSVHAAAAATRGDATAGGAPPLLRRGGACRWSEP